MPTSPPIYLNACSHGLPDPACAEVIARQALRSACRPGEEAEMREDARRACAALLGTEAASVGLGAGTFQLWAAVMDRLPPRPGRILVAAHEWGDNVRWLRRLAARSGVTLTVVSDEGGAPTDAATWAARMDDDVLALCMPLVTSIDGMRYPACEIASLARPEDALIVLDAAQALGRVPVAPDDLNCDVLVGTARKWLRGPRQTAMAWLSDRAERVLGCNARALEPLDLNAALLAGLARAVDLASDVSAISNRIGRLEGQLRSGLAHTETVEVNPAATVGTVICRVLPRAKAAVDAKLRAVGIVAKWCDAAQDEPLSNDDRGGRRLRLSPHVYNTERDVMAAVNALNAP